MGRFIRLNDDNIVIAWRIGNSIADGEIENNNAKIGQVMVEDGIFQDIDLTPLQLQINNYPKEREYYESNIITSEQFTQMTGEEYIASEI